MEKPAGLICLLATVLTLNTVGLGHTDVKPGDTVTKDNLDQAEGLLTPSVRWMVERGMSISVIETKKVEWPRAYREATEKYSAQVQIAADGREITNYIAGAPFPAIDINDPLAGYKIIMTRPLPPSHVGQA